MKIKIKITIILILCGFLCNAQSAKDSINKSEYDTTFFSLINSDWGITYSYDSAFKDNPYIVKWSSNGGFAIHGDTMAIIKLLWQKIDEAEKRELGMWQFVYRAIEFTNTVPDYLKNGKNNKSWNKYYAEVKKLGFKTVINKK